MFSVLCTAHKFNWIRNDGENAQFLFFFSWHNRQSSGSHNRVYTLWVKNGRWVENDPNETGKGMRHSWQIHTFPSCEFIIRYFFCQFELFFLFFVILVSSTNTKREIESEQSRIWETGQTFVGFFPSGEQKRNSEWMNETRKSEIKHETLKKRIHL